MLTLEQNNFFSSYKTEYITKHLLYNIYGCQDIDIT